MHVPMGKFRIHGIKPRIDSGFARVNFLPTPDETNNDSPFGMAIHARNQNSGSERKNPGRFFFRRMKLAVCRKFHARCASSKMTTRSAGGPESINASSRKL